MYELYFHKTHFFHSLTAYLRTVYLSVLLGRPYPVNALSHKERTHVAGLSYGSLVAFYTIAEQLSLFTLQFPASIFRRSSVVLTLQYEPLFQNCISVRFTWTLVPS